LRIEKEKGRKTISTSIFCTLLFGGLENLLLVMLHFDLEDINILFDIYPYVFVKKAWIEHVVAQCEMYYVLNKFFAWYYFKMKKPGAYVRSMATRELNKKLVA